MALLDPITRQFLIAVACATPNPTERLADMVEEMTTAGLYAEASQDEIEAFDKALDEAEAA